MAAGFVCAVFAAFVLIHLLWAAGITWALEEISDGGLTDASISLTVVSLAAAVVGAPVIYVTVGRVGCHETRLSDRLTARRLLARLLGAGRRDFEPGDPMGTAGNHAAAGDRRVRGRSVAP